MPGPAGEENVLVGAPYSTGELDPVPGDGDAYRVSAATPSGPLADVAPTTFVGGADGTGGPHGVFFAGDLDADGDPDLLVWDRSPYQAPDDPDASLYDAGLHGDVARASAWATLSSGPEVAAGDPAPCGDLDGNGTPDLCLVGGGSEEQPERVVFGPLGVGDTSVAGAGTGTVRTSPWRASWLAGGADVDGDGRDDATVVLADPPMLFLVSQLRAGDNDPSGSPSWLGALGGQIVDDLDGDGLPDLFAHDRLFVDKDGGSVSDAWWILDLDQEVPRNVASGDLDGDGAADLVVAAERGERDPWRILVFRGPLLEGTAGPEDADLVLEGRSPEDQFGSAMAVADVDADGREDLVVGAPHDDDWAGSVSLFLGASLFP